MSIQQLRSNDLSLVSGGIDKTQAIVGAAVCVAGIGFFTLGLFSFIPCLKKGDHMVTISRGGGVRPHLATLYDPGRELSMEIYGARTASNDITLSINRPYVTCWSAGCGNGIMWMGIGMITGGFTTMMFGLTC